MPVSISVGNIWGYTMNKMETLRGNRQNQSDNLAKKNILKKYKSEEKGKTTNKKASPDVVTVYINKSFILYEIETSIVIHWNMS